MSEKEGHIVGLIEITDANRENLLKLALGTYVGEKCKICGKTFDTIESLNDAVWAGPHEHGRIACKACWEKQEREKEEKAVSYRGNKLRIWMPRTLYGKEGKAIESKIGNYVWLLMSEHHGYNTVEVENARTVPKERSITNTPPHWIEAKDKATYRSVSRWRLKWRRHKGHKVFRTKDENPFWKMGLEPIETYCNTCNVSCWGTH